MHRFVPRGAVRGRVGSHAVLPYVFDAKVVGLGGGEGGQTRRLHAGLPLRVTVR